MRRLVEVPRGRATPTRRSVRVLSRIERNEIGGEHQDIGVGQVGLVHFLKNLAIAGGLVHIAGVGGGAFSLDGYTLEGRRSPA
jgi:hypothetical protein